MGLYKANYEVKELGLTLPMAYAVIRKIERRDGKGAAEIWVHQSREAALSKNFLERKIVQFKCNDYENPYAAAYRAALTKPDVPETYEEVITTTEEVDGELKEVQHKVQKVRMVKGDAPFEGWLNDVNGGDV
nr:MAG TPA: hypothetical protein [Caudoviricetes sp.]